MEDYGVHVTSGIQLQARTNIINELTETFHKPLIGQTPAKRMEEIGDKIAKIDTLIQTACLPYLGAGEGNSSRAIEGYFTERRMIMEDYIIKMNELADTKDQSVQGQIEVRFQIFPFHYFFEDAFYLAQHTFKPEQITPTHDRTTVLQTQMPFGMTPQNKPTGKEDQAGQEMWTEYMRQTEQRLARMERERENAKS